MVTTEMLSGLITSVTASVGTILPAGLSIMAVVLGVTIVPKLIKKFF